MQKLLRVGMVLLIIISLVACGSKSDKKSDKEFSGAKEEADNGSIDMTSDASDDAAPEGDVDGAPEGDADTDTEGDVVMDEAVGEDAPMVDKKLEVGETVVEGTEPETQATAGTLTAGEWNDNDNWGFLTNLVTTANLTFPSFAMKPMNRVVVQVTNGTDMVKNAKVVLLDDKDNVLWEAVTNYDGTAYVFYHVFDDKGEPKKLKVSKNGKETIQDIKKPTEDEDVQGSKIAASSVEYSITLEDSELPKSLDVMFVFDTTGSMGDELLYIQKEFTDIANKTKADKTRFSVNFYRDTEDEYVVKSNEFTADIADISEKLNAESAGGGDDFPEAVDQALEDAVSKHSWQDGSVKLLFLILDAPPHSSEEVNLSLQKTIAEAAKQGIRMIPIASSGVDKETETLLRTMSILTGGTYTFLTDDSGVGGSHLEPTIGSYKVEKLNDCIIRLIQLYNK